MFLIDELVTGSDPELQWRLAEIFLEYHREVWNYHYPLFKFENPSERIAIRN
jgi:hypothetical protein